MGLDHASQPKIEVSSMNYLLSCHCGRNTIVTRSQAGQVVLCACGNKLSVPTLRGLKELPPADALNVYRSSSTTLQAAESAWKGWRGILVSLLATIFVCSIGYGAWNLFQRLRVDTSYTEEVERQAGRELIDKMDLHALNDTFYQFTKVGVGEKSLPPFKFIQDYAQQCEQAIYYSMGVAAVAALGATVLMMASLVGSRSKNTGTP